MLPSRAPDAETPTTHLNGTSVEGPDRLTNRTNGGTHSGNRLLAPVVKKGSPAAAASGCHSQTSPGTAKSLWGHSNPHAHSGEAAGCRALPFQNTRGAAGVCSGP